MSFTGLAPEAVSALVMRMRHAADALEDSAGRIAAAGSLSGLGDGGLAGQARQVAAQLRAAAGTLTARAEHLGAFRLPAIAPVIASAIAPAGRVAGHGRLKHLDIRPAQVQTTVPPPRSHFMDDSMWLLASVGPGPDGRLPMMPGTTWGTISEGDIFGEVGPVGGQAGWKVEIRVSDAGVDVTFGSSVAISLENGTPDLKALGGAAGASVRWGTPPAWIAENVLGLLPNTGQYSRTFHFGSMDEFRAYWTVFLDRIGVDGFNVTDPAQIAFAQFTFAEIYEAEHTDPGLRSISLGQRFDISARVDLTPLNAFRSGDATIDSFLNRMALALKGEVEAAVEWDVGLDQRPLPDYTAPGATYALTAGSSTVVWIELRGEAEISATARTMLWGNQLGDQVKGEVRAGLVLDRWGQPRQVVVKAAVASYQFSNGMICVPLVGGGWLTIDIAGHGRIIEDFEPSILDTRSATLRVIEFNRVIDLFPDRTALAREMITLELDNSGVERLKLLMAEDPTIQAILDQARTELDQMLVDADQPEITDAEWLDLLDYTLKPRHTYSAGPFGAFRDEPPKLVGFWASGTPLETVLKTNGDALLDWTRRYLQPLYDRTQWSAIPAEEITAEVDRRMALMDTAPERDAFLAANGVDPAGWEISTLQGTVYTDQVAADVNLAGVAGPLADAAAAGLAGGIESTRTRYQQTGHWWFTQAEYDDLQAGFAAAPTGALNYLRTHNLARPTTTQP